MQDSLVFNRSGLNPVMLNVRSNRMQAFFVALFRSNQTKPIEPISNWFALPHTTMNVSYTHRINHIWNVSFVSFMNDAMFDKLLRFRSTSLFVSQHHSVAEYGYKCYESIFMLVIHALAIILHKTRITLSQ